MNFYKRHIGDYIKDAAHLSLLEHGVYARLMDVYYTRESGIPDGQAARLIGARQPAEVKAVDAVLSEFFHKVDGIWIQNRCEREIEEASAQAEKNRANGKKGGRPPKTRTPEQPNKTQWVLTMKTQWVSFRIAKNLARHQTPDTRHQRKAVVTQSSVVPLPGVRMRTRLATLATGRATSATSTAWRSTCPASTSERRSGRSSRPGATQG